MKTLGPIGPRAVGERVAFSSQFNLSSTEYLEVNKSGIDGYEGQVENGKRHGRGRQTYANGSVYDGEWLKDQRSGKGRQTYADRIVLRYDGEWLKDQRHGKGREDTVFGDYDGNWLNDNRHGFGQYNWTNGGGEEGEFKTGRLWTGRLTARNGKVLKVVNGDYVYG